MPTNIRQIHDEPTLYDVLEAINTFATGTDHHFAAIEQQISHNMEYTKRQFDHFQASMDSLERDIDHIKIRLDEVHIRTKEDDNAFASKIVSLRTRMKTVEKELIVLRKTRVAAS